MNLLSKESAFENFPVDMFSMKFLLACFLLLDLTVAIFDNVYDNVTS